MSLRTSKLFEIFLTDVILQNVKQNRHSHTFQICLLIPFSSSDSKFVFCRGESFCKWVS